MNSLIFDNFITATVVYISMYNSKHLFDGCIVNLTEVFTLIIAINNMLLQIAVK